MTNKIKTFEELFEKIKKSDLKMWVKFNKSANIIRLFSGAKNRHGIYKRFNYRIHKKEQYYYITIGVVERLIAPPTKNPQKIYNVIKSIKQCEELEDDK